MSTDQSTETRVCSKCGEDLPRAEFYRHSGRKDGLYAHCKHCHKKMTAESQRRNLGKRARDAAKWRAKNPEKAKEVGRASCRKRQYGITREQYQAMIEAHNGLCAACRRPPECGRAPVGRTPTLHIDHDHATGDIRGLLCHWCNLTLGHARDSAEHLRRLADYLDRAGSRPKLTGSVNETGSY